MDGSCVAAFVLHRATTEVDRQSIGHRLDPEVISQEILLDLWEKAPCVEGDLLAYLHGMIWHRVKDHVRRAVRNPHEPVPSEDLEWLGAKAALEEGYGSADEERGQSDVDASWFELAIALNGLTEILRYVFMRHHFDGVPLKVIAEERQEIFNTVRQRHVRAKRRLRKLLGR